MSIHGCLLSQWGSGASASKPHIFEPSTVRLSLSAAALLSCNYVQGYGEAVGAFPVSGIADSVLPRPASHAPERCRSVHPGPGSLGHPSRPRRHRQTRRIGVLSTRWVSHQVHPLASGFSRFTPSELGGSTKVAIL